MKLNAKQKIFVKEYLVDKNATRAAKAAGYSKKTAGSQGFDLLRKPEIKKLIEAEVAKRSKKLDITAERVVKRIAQFAFDKKLIKPSDTLKACELLGRKFNLFQNPEDLPPETNNVTVVLTLPSNGKEKSKDGED